MDIHLRTVVGMTGPEQLRKLADAASPGPWRASNVSVIGPSRRAENGRVIARTGLTREWADEWDTGIEDAMLIALAPELARLAADLADALANCLADIESFAEASGMLVSDPHTIRALLARVSRVAQAQTEGLTVREPEARSQNEGGEA